jgi:hypothetical protein
MRNIVLATVGALALGLSSCGGSGGTDAFGGTSGTSGTGGGGTTPTTSYAMGSGSGSSFQSGAIAIANASLPAGGTTSLTVSIVDQTGTLFTGAAVSITLNSPCISQGLATIAPAAPTIAGSTPGSVVTSSGTAEATYTAKGCSGSDVISASATVNSQSLTASGTVTVASAAIGSIRFTSATPATIGLKGTGLGETSTVVFTVVDATGGPRPGVTVSFSLNTTVGGLSLSPASATSASDGTVQTVVAAGTVHTAVRVTASIASPALSTQSSVLTVTTGLPASAAFSIAVGSANYGPGATPGPACPNVESYGIDGVTVPVTVRLADRYNNPVPDGTAVAFNADAGHIVGDCATPSSPASPGDGTCLVTWTSANPRPQPSGDTPPIQAPGRGMILATAIGEESFTDVNGDGFWESGEPFVNLGEPYRDDNENGQYDLGEYFLDFNQNGKWDAGNGTFKGIVCTGSSPGSTCSTTTLALGVEHLIIMTSSGAKITFVSAGGGFTGTGSGLTIAHGGTSGSLTVNVQDQNGNPMAAGTTITFQADQGVGTVSTLTGAYVVGCDTTLGGADYTTDIASAGAAGGGNLAVQVVSPGTGTKTTFIVPVTVN